MRLQYFQAATPARAVRAPPHKHRAICQLNAEKKCWLFRNSVLPLCSYQTLATGHKDLLQILPPNYSQCFCTAWQTFVRAAAGLARVVAVSSARNQARSGKNLPAAVLPYVNPRTGQRTHVSSPHTRTFAGTHLKIRRIVRLCIITLRIAASRHISAHPRLPTRPISRPLRPYFSFTSENCRQEPKMISCRRESRLSR